MELSSLALSYKQIARKEGVSLATAYRKYPPEKPKVTQVEVLILRFHNYSYAEVAEILGISKSMAYRLCQ